MNQQLLTKSQLAKRWEISIPTLNKRIEEGLISPLERSGHPRFNLEDVLKAEGTDTGKLSPFERKRLENEKRELEERVLELEEENRLMKSKITNSVADLSQILKGV